MTDSLETPSSEPTNRRVSPMRLVIVLALACLASIGLHELLYRRFTPADEADYELGGLVTHAAVDMFLMAGTVCLVGLIYELNRSSKED